MTSLCWTHLCTGLIKYSDRMLRMAELSSTRQIVVIQSFAVLDGSPHCISQNDLLKVAPTTTVATMVTINTTFFNVEILYILPKIYLNISQRYHSA
jgi:hypothetical protein